MVDWLGIKYYDYSVKATWSHGIWSGFGYLLFAFSFIYAWKGRNWWLIALGVIAWVLLNKFADRRADKIAARDYDKLMVKEEVKKQGLLELTTQEQFRIPAKIVITRTNNYCGIIATARFLINGKYIVKVKNNQSVTVETESAINEISLPGTYGKLNDRYLTRFSVREGETLELVYKFNDFKSYSRR